MKRGRNRFRTGGPHSRAGARALLGSASARDVVADAAGLAHIARALKSLHRHSLSLGQIRCPAFVLVGSRDIMGPAPSRVIRSELRQGILEIVRDGGHWLHLEAPDLVLAAIDRLLRAQRR
jgi:pimeloyl-ACP methyl ester carboxylesterase